MKRVAVIGAGVSGLAAVKTCLENNLNVVCYEWNTDIGGIWCYKPKAIEGMGSVAKSTIINTSKELMAFSDFPPEESFPNFMHHSEMLQYLRMYAEKFKLLPFIKVRHRVCDVVPCADYEENGRWRVKVLNEEDGTETEDEFDAVMVCVGHHGYPSRIEFPEQKKFRGNIIHSHEFKDTRRYEDKRVLVVGAGNSAADVAGDVSYIAKKTYLSTRRGFWIVRRTEDGGIPYDFNFLSRLFSMLISYVPFNILCWYIEGKFNQWFDHEMFQLKPTHRVLSQFPTVNDILPSRILSGRVVVKGNIERFEERGVIFDDGEFVEVDEVILATGYTIYYPFLKCFKADNNVVGLYKYIYPPDMKFPTLGIIGCVDILGGYAPAGEMQCRYFVSNLNDKASLPSKKRMEKDIQRRMDEIKRTYYASNRNTILAPFVQYLDELAAPIGVKPSLTKLLFTDFALFKSLLLGPCLPYQYRLKGSHSWPEARKTILSFEERFLAPLATRRKMQIKRNSSKNKIFVILLSVAILIPVVTMMLINW